MCYRVEFERRIMRDDATRAPNIVYSATPGAHSCRVSPR